MIKLHERKEQIHSLEAQTIVDVSCGSNYSAAICDGGNIFTWGAGSQGQLGSGQFPQQSPTPRKITGMSGIGIIQMSCGHFHTVALSEDSNVFSWGKNDVGQLELGKQMPNQASPQHVKSLRGVPLVQVSAGGSRSFALSMLGVVFGWGMNNAGQIGLPNDPLKADVFKPYAVRSLRDKAVIYISCGDEHTAVLNKDGTVYTFGDGTKGQLGRSSLTNTSEPQKIEEYEGQVSQIACGSYDTLLYVFTSNQIVSFGRGVETKPDDHPLEVPFAFDSSKLLTLKDLKDIHLKQIFAGSNVSFASSTMQPQEQVPTAIKILRTLTEFAGGSKIILGGDWNLVLNPERDSSSVHNTYTRIDMILVTQDLLDFAPRCSLGDFIWSDHAPVYCGFSRRLERAGVTSWRLNDNLLRDPVCVADIKTAIAGFIADHQNDQTSAPIQWETLKCVIRGILISHGSRRKKENAANLHKLILNLQTKEAANKKSQRDELKAEISTIRHQILKILDQRSLAYRDKLRRGAFEYADKCGSWLARALHPRSATSHVSKIQVEDSEPVHATTDILEEFKKYYTKLYNIKDITQPDTQRLDKEMETYLNLNAPKRITAEEAAGLDEDFSSEELGEIIKDLKVGKCLGPDGFTARFYKIFREEISPLIIRAFNAVDRGCPFPMQSLMAHISVIPKPGKDASVCGNYRPISLLNVDIKIFAKLISTRLQKVIPLLIHGEQVGFIPGREARDNTIKSLSLIARAGVTGDPLCLLAVDAEKAFDRLRGFVGSLVPQVNLAGELTPFEQMVMSASPQRHMISSLYKLMQSREMEAQSPTYIDAWEKELGYSLTNEDWERAWTLCHKMSPACRAQDLNFKILSRWEIIKLFSAPACLTASLKKKKRASSSDPSLPMVDLHDASELFTKLCQNKWIADIICSSLKDELIPATENLPSLFEANSVFLLFPECPVMHDINVCLPLAAPLAQAITNLSSNALQMLDTLWSSLPEPSLSKQIQVFKIALVLSVFNNNRYSTKNILEVLKKLYRANMKAGYKVPINYFCVPEVSHVIIVPVDLRNWRMFQKQTDVDGVAQNPIYCRYPFIFTFDTKIQYLDHDAFVKKNVEFHGEVTTDPRATMTEFFLLVAEKMVQPDFGLFASSDPLLPLWFPSRPLLDKKMYYHYGILCGLAIFSAAVIYIPFPLALFKKLLSKKVTLEDLKELQPIMGRSMQSLLDTTNERDVKSLQLYFTLSWENQTVELVPNGATERVTHLNKHNYVNKCVEYIFNTSVAETFEEFKKGLYKVCDKDILFFFQPKELMDLVAGHANYDWTVFEKNTTYMNEYSPVHPTIIMFWKVFQLPLEKKKGFLHFLTGNDKIPLFRIQNAFMKISSFGVPNESYLPEANTCSLLLLLPKYSRRDVLRRKLLQAIENNKGLEKN
ncbi:LOW QUALITY PROTEIN: probable E3 ubiquitin-protein ligase HERC6 [Eleutherodactylus coqui]|uniref:LOW QUALITY PROTEIN: probable E3 ubiquitin-protein ligase HERC6 n=1 Tax=Eleutherodactylus coqui TaxID=57060 RepID=UPI003462B197